MSAEASEPRNGNFSTKWNLRDSRPRRRSRQGQNTHLRNGVSELPQSNELARNEGGSLSRELLDQLKSVLPGDVEESR